MGVKRSEAAKAKTNATSHAELDDAGADTEKEATKETTPYGEVEEAPEEASELAEAGADTEEEEGDEGDNSEEASEEASELAQLAQGEKTACTRPTGKCDNCRWECCSCRQGKSRCFDGRKKIC